MRTNRFRRSLPGVKTFFSELGVLPGKILRYGITKYPRHDLHKNISQRDLRRYVDEALRKAIKLWGDAIDVKFVEWRARELDISVSFSTFYHGDEYPFDGVGNEVAHAFYPSHQKRRGQIHIDDNEPWGPNGRNLNWVLAHEVGHSLGLPHTMHESIMMPQYGGFEEAKPRLFPYDIITIQQLYGKGPNGRNLNWVLAHEVGHSLGLPHTMHESIMMPQYGGFEEAKPRLFPYDIITIQQLYGKKKGFDEMNLLQKQNEQAEIPQTPSLCDGKPIDTIFAFPNGTMVVFKGENFWMLGNVGNTSAEGPFSIHDFFGQIQLPIDAAFTDHLDWTWFIKGDLVWRVDASADTLRLFAPEELHEVTPFSNYIYNSVDAVLSITEDASQTVFFFLGPKYWYDGNSDGDTDAGYYRQIREIDYRLKKVDAAVSLPDGNFIFSDDSYWKVNPARNSLKVARVF
uniref:Peptidase metallopeptidase domain-containing protein n=1 Tax=Ascaris lumbricoides TaxID=6252 RepID=A0A9J2PQP9_ASCLU